MLFAPFRFLSAAWMFLVLSISRCASMDAAQNAYSLHTGARKVAKGYQALLIILAGALFAPFAWALVPAGESSSSPQLQLQYQKNGPTGWITLDDGSRLRLLRVGTLNSREVVVLETSSGALKNAPDGSGESQRVWVPLEDVSSIEIDEKRKNSPNPMAAAFRYRVTLRDGQAFFVQQLGFLARRLNSGYSSHGYGVGKTGMPVVVVDSGSGEPHTRIFPSVDGFKKIEFDPAQDWDSKPNQRIPSNYEQASVQDFRARVQQANRAAEQQFQSAAVAPKTVGASVCSADNRMGYVEQVAGSRLKLLLRGRAVAARNAINGHGNVLGPFKLDTDRLSMDDETSPESSMIELPVTDSYYLFKPHRNVQIASTASSSGTIWDDSRYWGACDWRG